MTERPKVPDAAPPAGTDPESEGSRVASSESTLVASSPELRESVTNEVAVAAGPRAEQFSESHADSLVGTVVADRYRVLELLGKGGMGAVYRAEHIHMMKPVAIKILHRQLTVLPEIVARFEREAIAAGRINHPNVATASDFGQLADGAFYLVLEYLEGQSLAQLLEGGAEVTQLRALKLTRQIADALAAAHDAGIVHRDLKPENVMLVPRPEDPDFVKVFDFGIAKVAFEHGAEPGKALTRTGAVFGTPQYMAPEQALGGEVDARSDLYTVGLMLYELLVGQLPFNDEDVTRIIAAQINQTPPELPSWVDDRVAKLTMKLLEKERDKRVQSAAELRDTIDGLLADLGGAGLGSGARPRSGRSDAVTEGAGVLDVGSGRGRGPSRGLVLGVAVGLLAIAVVGGVVLTRDPGTQPALDPAAAPAGSAELELKELFGQAAAGDQAALAKLEARPDGKRSAAEWVALGQGRMVQGKVAQALDAYEQALEEDDALAEDQTLIHHVREAAKLEESAPKALDLAAQRLGRAGADLLYDVWVATKAKTAVTQRAKELVYSDAVRENASPALAVVLKLRKAEECEQYHRLLPDATLHGDVRALRVLAPLSERTGCGENEKEDCYVCLRDSDALTNAIKAVRARPEPQL